MVDLRCPELADLETRLAGELIPVDDELYGLWCEHKERSKMPPSWFWYDNLAWFTPDVRVAYAQQSLMVARYIEYKWSTSTLRKITVCRLGPQGEPLELSSDMDDKITEAQTTWKRMRTQATANRPQA